MGVRLARLVNLKVRFMTHTKSSVSSDRPAEAPIERLGFAALSLFALSPIVAQGVWGRGARALHARANSWGVTGAALGVAVVAFVASLGRRNRRFNRSVVATIAGGVALFLAVLLGARGGFASMSVAGGGLI